MKKLLLGSIFVLCTFLTMNAQQVDYTLEWNETDSRYDIFITRDIDGVVPFTNSGVTRITVVLPVDATRTAGSISRVNYGPDSYAIDLINAPAAQPGNDFLNFSTIGGSSYVGVLTGGVKTLWISFTTANGCESGTRLYINGSDPNSGAAGMNGVDYSQGFSVLTIGGITDEYNINSGGDPSCMPLGVEDVLIADVIQLYPNPTTESFTIKGLQEKAIITIYSINGKLVFEQENYTDSLVDISHLSSGVYFVKAATKNGTLTKKLVKQ